MNKIFFISVATLLLTFVSSSDGFEDQLIEGNTIIPVGDCNVRMISEKVVISEKTKITASYTLQNLSNDSSSCKMGFPISIGADLQDFKVMVNERVVQFKRLTVLSKGELVLNKRYNNLSAEIFVWDVPFIKRGNTNVQIQYSGTWNSTWHERTAPYFVYIIKTGAQWKGKIDKADFYIELDEFVVGLLNKGFTLFVAPKNYIINKNKLEWHYSNWEPSENISIFAIEETDLENEKKSIQQFLQTFDYDNDRLIKGINKKFGK